MERREFLVGAGATLGSVLLSRSVLATHTGVNGDVSVDHVSSHWPSAAEWTMLDYINDYRASMGRGRLEMSRTLAASARHHAYYMSRTDDVDHTLTGEGISWAQNVYNYGYPEPDEAGEQIGENVAAGRSSAGGTLNQWKASSSHNANLLYAVYTRAGVGRVYYGSGDYDYYWCLNLGWASHRTIYQ